MFRVSARTLFQLGAELISSDGIAFYELIKNAFDASSPRVDIDIDVAFLTISTSSTWRKHSPRGMPAGGTTSDPSAERGKGDACWCHRSLRTSSESGQGCFRCRTFLE